MKKTIKYSLISFTALSCTVIFYLLRPMGGYLGGETFWGKLESIYINLSPDRSLNQNAISLLQYINSNATLKDNYKKAFSGAQNDDDFIGKTYNFGLFRGFAPVKIEDKCFIFRANVDVVNKSVGGEIRKYKKESPTTTAECKINCSVYFTEKGLLSEDDIYYCN